MVVGGMVDTLVRATGSEKAVTSGVLPPTTVVTPAAGRPPVPLENLLAGTVFSSWHGNAPVQAAAHVVIEGQAAPETPLTLFGKRVQLRVDRSFTLRLPLKRGPDLVALLHHLYGRYGDWGEG